MARLQLILFIGMVALAGSNAAIARDASFAAPGLIIGGADPRSVAISDFDSNGLPDLAIACSSDNEVRVLFRECDNSYRSPVVLSVSGSPVDIAVGDFNEDAALDLAVALVDQSAFSLFFGDGSGGWSPEVQQGSVGTSFRIEAADFDHDGSVDLALLRASTLTIHYGTGLGAFSAGLVLDVGGSAQNILAADINADSRADLIVPRGTANSISVILAADVGGFLEATDYAVGAFPTDVAVGDFDGNGTADVATTNANSDNVSIHLGDGSGQLTADITVPVGASPRSVVTADYDGDGAMDLALTLADSNSVEILVSTSGGEFELRGSQSIERPNFLGTADLNGNGQLDLVATSLEDDLVYVILGAGDGTLERHVDLVADENASRVMTADLNDDGIPDLLVGVAIAVGSISGELLVYHGQSDGNLILAQTLTLASGPESLTLGDFNHDGTLDLGLLRFIPGPAFELELLLDVVGGTFGSPQSVLSGVQGKRRVAAGHLDGDGNLDLIVADERFGAVDGLTRLLGDGAGGFAELPFLAHANTPHGIAIEDVNEDGHGDVISASAHGFIDVFYGNGTGALSGPISFPVGVSTVRSLTTADVNNDGHVDCVVGLISSNGLAVLLGRGDGGFDSPTYHGDGLSIWSEAPQIADVNNDGHLDIVTAQRENPNPRILVLLGDGAGNFRSTSFYHGARAWNTAVADFDRDGWADIVATGQDTLRLYLNTAAGFPDCNGNDRHDACDIALEPAADQNGNGVLDECELFARGDVDGDGLFVINDAVLLLDHLFASGSIPCRDAADIDDDGSILINDPILFLEFLFGSGPVPAAPGPGAARTLKTTSWIVRAQAAPSRAFARPYRSRRAPGRQLASSTTRGSLVPNPTSGAVPC